MRNAFLLSGLVVLVCSFALAQTHTLKSSSGPSRTDLKSPYERWASEDVAYMITPEEKQAFLMLKSDAEHEQFIEKFWSERAAKAGVSEDAFRTEHYRRIAFANRRFGLGKVPGWKTAKGRNYIMTGRA